VKGNRLCFATNGGKGFGGGGFIFGGVVLLSGIGEERRGLPSCEEALGKQDKLEKGGEKKAELLKGGG